MCFYIGFAFEILTENLLCSMALKTVCHTKFINIFLILHIHSVGVLKYQHFAFLPPDVTSCEPERRVPDAANKTP